VNTNTTWLREQVGRNDPVGDLANNSLQDSQWPEHGTSLEQFATAIRFSGAGNTSGAIAALHQAWEEWKETEWLPQEEI
jgi:uncharacterized protein YozE (UPF0346 family)